MRTNDAFCRAFGENVKRLRRAQGLSQQDLADVVGVTTLTVSNIERGTHPPAFFRLQELARALEVEIHELFLFE